MNKQYEIDRQLIYKYTKNDYINKIYKDWGVKLNGIFYKINSNISVKECIFIHLLIKIKKPKKVLEIGLATGMSSMVILNALNMFDGEILYSVDPFQKTQWNSVGLYNIDNVKQNIKHKLVEKLSDVAFDEFENNFFDMILIDGPHDKMAVIGDINNTKRVLKINGIMILDDILHKGVSEAIKEVLINDTNYKRICINYDNIEKCNKNSFKKFNPMTMSSFIKLK